MLTQWFLTRELILCTFLSHDVQQQGIKAMPDHLISSSCVKKMIKGHKLSKTSNGKDLRRKANEFSLSSLVLRQMTVCICLAFIFS